MADSESPNSTVNGDLNHVALAALVLVVISPGALLAAVMTVYLVVRQVRSHWREWARPAVGTAVVIAAVMQLITGNALAAQFGGYVTAVTVRGSWVWAMARTLPLGIPIGVAAGAAYVGLAESWAGRAECHPVEQRRRAVAQYKILHMRNR